MDSAGKLFRVQFWKRRVYEAISSFSALDQLVSDDAAIAAHKDMLRLVTRGGLARFGIDFADQSIRNAHSTHRRQIIVLAASYADGVVKEFVRTYFVVHPMAMHDFLGAEKHRGHVSLSDISESASIGELVSDLSDRAASEFMKAKSRNRLERLFRFAPDSAEPDLELRLRNLYEKRNRIVHEGDETEVTSEEATTSLLDVGDLLLHLEQRAGEEGIETEPDPLALAIDATRFGRPE